MVLCFKVNIFLILELAHLYFVSKPNILYSALSIVLCFKAQYICILILEPAHIIVLLFQSPMQCTQHKMLYFIFRALYIIFLFQSQCIILYFVSEPNIDSPLNMNAAELWSNHAAYKAYLLQKYDQDVRNKQLSS